MLRITSDNQSRVYRSLLIVAIIVGAVILVACVSPYNPAPLDLPASRSFYMGFTPWPYRSDADFSEIFYTYDLIQDYGDIVAHHFQQGIPYPESYAMRSAPTATGLPGYDAGGSHSLVYGEVDLRAGQTDVVTNLYLAIDSTDANRDDLIGYFGTDYDGNGSTEQQTRPDNSGASPDISGFANTIDWSTLTFADLEVAEAFVSYSRALIDEFTARGFTVSYFNYASEISDLLLADEAEYADFLIFADRVYAALKAVYPSLPLMVSIALKHPDSTEAQSIVDGLGDLMDYADVVGISVYPYAFFSPAVESPAGLPSDWVRQITAIAGAKPVAFTETGWIAEDLAVAGFSLERAASEVDQDVFTRALMDEAAFLNAEFIIWFSLVDYSHYWANALGSDDLSALWRDTGIIDYNGTTNLNEGFDFAAIASTPLRRAGLSERYAAETWTAWLGVPKE